MIWYKFDQILANGSGEKVKNCEKGYRRQMKEKVIKKSYYN